MILIRLGASIPIPSATVAKVNGTFGTSLINEYNDIIEPLSNELKTKLTDFPVTIVYVESLEALGYIQIFSAANIKQSHSIHQPRYISVLNNYKIKSKLELSEGSHNLNP
jgi:hypothetical protein